MAEFKPKPVPVIILTVLLIWGVYRVWYSKGTSENNPQDSAGDTAIDKGGGSNANKAKGLGMTKDADATMPVTKQDIIEFFKISEKDGLKITWSHMTNSLEDLEKALQDESILMVEGDICMNNTIPIMAHAISDGSSNKLTLRSWLTNFYDNTKGMKLDIKTTEAVEPSLAILKEVQSHLKVPVWLNADILKGPNGQDPMVDATKFFETVEKIFPDATLSVGWTTGYLKSSEGNQPYTNSMVTEMYEQCKNKYQPITFPVRASLVRKSLENLQWLVNKVNRSTLTLWHGRGDTLDVNDLVAIRKTFERHQIFYDLPGDLMKRFVEKISTSES